MGHVGNLLPPLEEQRLSFFWEIDVGKLGHESSQVTHIGSVGGLMLSSKLKKFVEGYGVQIEANGLKVEGDDAVAGRHSLPRKGIHEVRDRGHIMGCWVDVQVVLLACRARELGEEDEDSCAHYRVKRDRDAVFAGFCQPLLLELRHHPPGEV